MMLKKFTAIFFITLASMVMHTFAVIPHHHHLHYICFNSNHCETNPVDQHSHDNQSNSVPVHSNHGCIRSLFQTQVSRIESLAHACAHGHCHHFTFIPFLVPDQLLLLSLEAEELAKSPVMYREKLHAICYISCSAGRAPPVCEC